MKAILEQHGISVVIGNGEPVDDEVLPAYKYDDTLDDDTPELTKQCWIPAEPGSNFCIHCAWNGKSKSIPRKDAGLDCDVYIDHWLVAGAFLSLRGIDDNPTKNRECEITGVYDHGPTGSAERPFAFKEAPTDVIYIDMDEIDTSGKGTIRVIIRWATVHSEPSSPTMRTGDVNELAIELEAHDGSGEERFMSCVGFGDPIKADNVYDEKLEWIDDTEYTFIFHYAHPGETF